MFSTNDFFDKGKLSIVMDASAGSSGKGKVGSFIAEHADNFQFCANTFAPQAGHWVRLDDGTSYFYQSLNSCAYLHEKFERMYIGPGAIIEKPAFFREIEENGIPRSKIKISPITQVLQDIDGNFERGLCCLDGKPIDYEGIAIKSGTTAHGVGACRARKVLRRSNVLLARDDEDLKEFIADVPAEIMDRLEAGEAGLMEIAQGFQLSMGLSDFYPYTTSRNVTVAAGLDDLMIPPVYAGQVLLNCRTYPIRINSKKYVAEDGRHLTWDEIQSGKWEYRIEESYSGPWYDDQVEIDWDKVTRMGGSPEQIMEMTSVTKMPRRVFTWSKKNLHDAILHNRTGSRVGICINFANYIDYELTGRRGDLIQLTDKFKGWMRHNVFPVMDEMNTLFAGQFRVSYIGTGAKTDDMIQI